MESLQQSWILLMLIIGTVASAVAYLSFRVPRPRSGTGEKELEEFAADIRFGNGRIPTVLWLLFIGMACFLAGYVAYVHFAMPNF